MSWISQKGHAELQRVRDERRCAREEAIEAEKTKVAQQMALLQEREREREQEQQREQWEREEREEQQRLQQQDQQLRAADAAAESVRRWGLEREERLRALGVSAGVGTRGGAASAGGGMRGSLVESLSGEVRSMNEGMRRMAEGQHNTTGGRSGGRSAAGKPAADKLAAEHTPTSSFLSPTLFGAGSASGGGSVSSIHMRSNKDAQANDCGKEGLMKHHHERTDRHKKPQKIRPPV